MRDGRVGRRTGDAVQRGRSASYAGVTFGSWHGHRSSSRRRRSPATRSRGYARHLLIPEVGLLGQRRLKTARVLVVGAGGLGSPALLYLAAAGVGTIGVVDDDVVEASNLQRQVVHGVGDVGRPKTDSAADTLAEVNPLVTVVRHDVRLDSGNALELIGRLRPRARRHRQLRRPATSSTTPACCSGKPHVWGSIYRFDGQVSVWWAEHGPCYRCVFPEPPPPGMVPSCAEGGVLGRAVRRDRVGPGDRGGQAADGASATRWSGG